jgi:hypothetical protein
LKNEVVMDDKNVSLNTVCDKKRCQSVEVPTQDETVALNALRDIKKSVRIIKARLSEIAASKKDEDLQERKSLEKELRRLKIEWLEWDKKKEKAARERMILLGHIDP